MEKNVSECWRTFKYRPLICITAIHIGQVQVRL